MDDPWNISPELGAVKSELEGLGADNLTGPYLTIIESAADRAKNDQASINNEQIKNTLSELNTLLRSLKRSNISTTKLRAKLSALSANARVFLTIELTRLQHQSIDLDRKDWVQA